jgi:hypothetical protein
MPGRVSAAPSPSRPHPGGPATLRAAPVVPASPAVELPHVVQLRSLGPGKDHLPSQLHSGRAVAPLPLSLA